MGKVTTLKIETKIYWLILRLCGDYDWTAEVI